MTKYVFQAADLIAQIRKLAAEHPAHKQPGNLCSHKRKLKGQMACLVGEAAYYLEPLDGLTMHNTVGDAALNGKIIGTTKELRWLRAVQNFQDAGELWSRAVHRSDEDEARDGNLTWLIP